MRKSKLIRKFKDEAVGVYSIDEEKSVPGLIKYIISTRCTRDLMNHPEIINYDFTKLMQNGITNALKGLNILERLSQINSRTVNVFHILRGGLNFQVRESLKKAFGYEWHSSSYISSQRVLQDGGFQISEDSYRKFIVPDKATIYTADIVASGVSLDHSLEYLDTYLKSKDFGLENMVFITIGGKKAEEVLEKWHNRFKSRFPGYKKTYVIYLEGRFALAGKDTKLDNFLFHTDLLKDYKSGALLTPEYEYSQFEKMIISLEACAIYDGGKKSFEPINHILDIKEFWEKQLDMAKRENRSLWDEYNARFPLDLYFKDFHALKKGSAQRLAEEKSVYWEGIKDLEYQSLYRKFKWLWTEDRINAARKPGSFRTVCEKKIRYLNSLI